MGEAIYYGKIVFNSAQEAEVAFEDFKALCLEVCKAGDYWQENRGGPIIGAPFTDIHKEMTDKVFWTVLEEQFPKAADYLKSIEHGRHGETIVWGGDRNNGLAGLLEPIGHVDDVENIHLDMNEIHWSAEVWHFADWGPFCQYVEKKFAGVNRTGWLSDEYAEVDYWAMI